MYPTVFPGYYRIFSIILAICDFLPVSGEPEANVHTQELRGLCLDRDF